MKFTLATWQRLLLSNQIRLCSLNTKKQLGKDSYDSDSRNIGTEGVELKTYSKARDLILQRGLSPR